MTLNSDRAGTIPYVSKGMDCTLQLIPFFDLIIVLIHIGSNQSRMFVLQAVQNAYSGLLFHQNARS